MKRETRKPATPTNPPLSSVLEELSPAVQEKHIQQDRKDAEQRSLEQARQPSPLPRPTFPPGKEIRAFLDTIFVLY